MNVVRDAKGKWVSPDVAKKVNKKQEYEMTGTVDVEITSNEDITNVM